MMQNVACLLVFVAESAIIVAKGGLDEAKERGCSTKEGWMEERHPKDAACQVTDAT
jgi:hypothetical protein